VWGLLLGVPVAVFIIRCVILDEEIPGLIEHKLLPQEVGGGRGLPPAGRDAFAVEAGERKPEPVGAGGGKAKA
jgi:hypothetical protein